MRSRFYRPLILITSLIAAFSCNYFPTPEQPEEEPAFNTMVAQTAFVMLTEAAQQAQPTLQPTQPEPTEPQPTVPVESPPEASPLPTLIAPTEPVMDATAPFPLPMTTTGAILRENECFDLDMWGVVEDERCDLRLDAVVIIAPQNGARYAGNANMEPPTLAECRGVVMTEDPFAPLTDLYICLQTNEGSYGFFVMRHDQWLDQRRIVFDWWLFP